MRCKSFINNNENRAYRLVGGICLDLVWFGEAKEKGLKSKQLVSEAVEKNLCYEKPYKYLHPLAQKV